MPLPVFHWFVQNVPAPLTPTTGTRASVYLAWASFMTTFSSRVRGASAPSFPKKPYKFDFNPGDHFRFLPDAPRVDEINLNTTYQDKAYVRQPLTYETYRDAGVPAADAFNVRVQQNSVFYSVAVLTEQLDDTFLERRNLDPRGCPLQDLQWPRFLHQRRGKENPPHGKQQRPAATGRPRSASPIPTAGIAIFDLSICPKSSIISRPAPWLRTGIGW